MVAAFAKVGDFYFSNWKSWLIGAIVIAAPIILRAINPEDKSYGFKAKA
jgi:hypothetical protein